MSASSSLSPVRTFDHRRVLPEIEDEVLAAVRRVLASDALILGPETAAFEREFADYAGSQHCVAVGSGTSAIHLALWALGVGPGDEVLTVSNTCAPTISAIRMTGANPVFADVREDDLSLDVSLLERHLTARTRAVVPVHLWGMPADLEPLLAFARRHSLRVVEDCAQAHGSLYRGKKVGTFGDAGCFSFYPTKNIGAFGDAGAVVTDDGALAANLRARRMYGYDERAVSQVEGTNARGSELQCAILRIKLRRYEDWLARRRRTAARYDAEIENPAIRKPHHHAQRESTYHQYVVRCEERARLGAWLKEHGVGFGIHYAVPVHLMPAYAAFGGAALDLPVTCHAADRILSLPVHEGLDQGEVTRVIQAVNSFPTNDR